MIFFVRLEMLSQKKNSLTQERYLYLWRTRIRFVDPVFTDHLRLLFYRQGHLENDTPRLTLISLCSESRISQTDGGSEGNGVRGR